jgi:Rrf2 family protein
MLLTKSSEYAIKMVMYLVQHPKDEYTPIKEIAEKTGISFYRLGKIAQQLTKARILESYTCPHGGVLLAQATSSHCSTLWSQQRGRIFSMAAF